MKTTPILVLFALLSAVSCRRSEVQRLDGEGRTFSVAATAGEFEPSTAAGSTANAFGSSAVQKASRATETAFQQSDRIGLFVTEGVSSIVTSTGNHSSNVPYRYDAGEWRAAGSLAAPLDPTKSYRATAYSPYKQGVTNPLAVDHEVYADQSGASGAEAGALELSDLMVAGASAVTGVSGVTPDPKVSLAFTHAMAKFVTTFAVPSVLDGADVQSLTSVTYKNMVLNCQVNLATGAVSAAATPVKSDVLPRLTSTNGTAAGATVFYEAIVPPQGFAVGTGLVELKFATSGGEKTMGYVVPAGGVTLSKNQKYTLSLSSIADLAFVSEIPAALLLDGLAHTDIPIRIKSKDNWTLTSNNAWLTVSKTAGSGYTTSVSGVGSADPQTVYVSLAANTSTVLARMSVLTLASTVNTKLKDTYTVNQNYFSVNNSGNLAWSPAAGEATKAVDAFDGNQVIRVVSDASRADGSASWLRLGSSATYGSGSVVDSVEVVGALSASTWWLQASANNTNAARTTTVRYLPVDADGNPVYSGQKTQLVTQAAPSIVLSLSAVSLPRTAAPSPDTTVFTVTAPVGVKWKVLSKTDGAGPAALGGTVVPAVGVEQVGTGLPQAVKLSGYTAIAQDADPRTSTLVIAYAAYGAGQQHTVVATQVGIPEFITIGNLEWATGNLVANGPNGCKIGTPADYGLYFHFGSLVGWSGGLNGDGRGQGTPELAQVVTPVGYTGSIVWPAGYWGGGGTEWQNLTATMEDNAATGIGDPCRYYLKENWRLPTSFEQVALVGTDSRYAVPWTTAGLKGRWVTSEQNFAGIFGPGAWIGPSLNEGSGIPDILTCLFFNANGNRQDSDGKLVSVNEGRYASSTREFAETTGCRWLYVGESGYATNQVWSRSANGLNVRCVQNAPTYVPPGGVGYITTGSDATGLPAGLMYVGTYGGWDGTKYTRGLYIDKRGTNTSGVNQGTVDDIQQTWGYTNTYVDYAKSFDGFTATYVLLNSPAANYCRNKGRGWFLPSIQQVESGIYPAIKAGIPSVYSFRNNTYYWSAWPLGTTTTSMSFNMTTGVGASELRTASRPVRCVMEF